MKPAELKTMNIVELDKAIEQNRQKLADLIIEMRTKKVSDIKQVSKIKKTIARALTIRQQRSMEVENGA